MPWRRRSHRGILVGKDLARLRLGTMNIVKSGLTVEVLHYVRVDEASAIKLKTAVPARAAAG